MEGAFFLNIVLSVHVALPDLNHASGLARISFSIQ